MKFYIIQFILIVTFSNLRAQNDALKNSIGLGEKIYLRKCAVCHAKDGNGRGKRIPPLANSDYLFNNQEASIRGILFGLNEEIIVNGTTYNRKMKAVKLTNEEVANVMNYIQNSWGNKNDKMVTEKKVDKIRSGINP